MPINFTLRGGDQGCQPQACCISKDGCPCDRCPDFTIRRHDTKPDLKVAIEDCNGPMDFRGLVIEANMWALAKLKADIADDATYFRLADDIGFEQIMVGDIIVMDRVRAPEHMLVTAFDETNKLVQVQRGYHSTTASAWKKGTTLRIFRTLSAPAEAEMVFEDVQDVDGTVHKNEITAAYLIYEWQPQDTCLPGCYWLEFKVLKMIDIVWFLPGGHWIGDVVQDGDGYFWTGTAITDGSVRLSYDQVRNYYLIPQYQWDSAFIHLWSDGNYWTGTTHTDSSVVLVKNGSVIPDNTEVGPNTGIGTTESSLNLVSITPSFSQEGFSPEDYGCVLGEGVEWVRRFPIEGEGFLIKIAGSPTTEI
jgi:hypothetical protein